MESLLQRFSLPSIEIRVPMPKLSLPNFLNKKQETTEDVLAESLHARDIATEENQPPIEANERVNNQLRQEEDALHDEAKAGTAAVQARPTPFAALLHSRKVLIGAGSLGSLLVSLGVFGLFHHSAIGTAHPSVGVKTIVVAKNAVPIKPTARTVQHDTHKTIAISEKPHPTIPVLKMPEDGVLPGAADADDDINSAALRSMVPQLCGIHAAQTLRWNFSSGYLLCHDRSTSGNGTYLLERSDGNFTYLGGLEQAPSVDGVVALGVDTATAAELVKGLHP